MRRGEGDRLQSLCPPAPIQKIRNAAGARRSELSFPVPNILNLRYNESDIIDMIQSNLFYMSRLRFPAERQRLGAFSRFDIAGLLSHAKTGGMV
jgi:hypothetical protein